MTKPKRKPMRSWRGWLKALSVVGVGLVVSAVLITWQRTGPASPDRPRAGLPFYATEDEARPFPETLAPESFGTRYVSHAYRVAKEIPGVLAPC